MSLSSVRPSFERSQSASVPTLVGRSRVLRDLDREVTCAARSDAKVLITGESGVGKEVLSQLVHARSRRSKGPFVVINCAGVPETLLESELFGHERGSFTGAYFDRAGRLEMAHGGTIFLDEVGEMSLRMQGLLLRFLETGELQRVGGSQTPRRIDVRVIAATNRCLDDEVARGAFREDLYYRLNVIHFEVPPLRERVEDVAPLAHHFLAAFSAQYGLPAPEIADEALGALETYHWPGNVRELRNVVERSLVRRSSGRIVSSDLPDDVFQPAPSAASVPGDTADALFARMAEGGESFWSVVFEPFEARDLTRDDVREVLKRGLAVTWGSYRALMPLFNLDGREYRRFMRAIRKHDCDLPFQLFNPPAVSAAGSAGVEERIPQQAAL